MITKGWTTLKPGPDCPGTVGAVLQFTHKQTQTSDVTEISAGPILQTSRLVTLNTQQRLYTSLTSTLQIGVRLA